MRPGNNVQTSRCQRAAEFRVSLGAASFVVRVLSRMARQKSGSMCLSKNKLGHAYSLMRVGLLKNDALTISVFPLTQAVYDALGVGVELLKRELNLGSVGNAFRQ